MNLLKNTRKGIFENQCKVSKRVHKKHNKLSFLSERMKVRKVKKSVSNLKDKKMYAVHIKNLNQELNHGLKIKKIL